MLRKCLLLISITNLLYFSYAVPVNGKIFELTQPNNKTINVKVFGDEFYRRVESMDGYTLVLDKNTIINKKTGWICYAELSENGSKLVSTGIPYFSKNSPYSNIYNYSYKVSTLEKGIIISKQSREKQIKQNREQIGRSNDSASIKNINEIIGHGSQKEISTQSTLEGQIKGITILIDFPDDQATVSKEKINDLLNKTGYNGGFRIKNNGSVKDYFYDISNKKIEYTNIVTNYYRAQKNKSYYDNTDDRLGGTRVHELIHEALQWLTKNNVIDLTKLTLNSDDHIIAPNFYYAGSPSGLWSTGLWPHKGSIKTTELKNGIKIKNYQMTNIGKTPEIGTFIHENGHLIFNWPDVYYRKVLNKSDCLGGYCLMGRFTDNHNPPPPNPYFRYKSGLLNYIPINTPNSYINISGTNNNQVYAYFSPLAKKDYNDYYEEYFLIEGRSNSDRNSSLGINGVLIWDINTKENGTGVRLKQADGRNDLKYGRELTSQADIYTTGKIFNDTSKPNSKLRNETSTRLTLKDFETHPLSSKMKLFITISPNSIPIIDVPSKIDFKEGEELNLIPYIKATDPDKDNIQISYAGNFFDTIHYQVNKGIAIVEDAENGNIDNWWNESFSEFSVQSATITNEYDQIKKSRVIKLNGSNTEEFIFNGTNIPKTKLIDKPVLNFNYKSNLGNKLNVQVVTTKLKTYLYSYNINASNTWTSFKEDISLKLNQGEFFKKILSLQIQGALSIDDITLTKKFYKLQSKDIGTHNIKVIADDKMGGIVSKNLILNVSSSSTNNIDIIIDSPIIINIGEVLNINPKTQGFDKDTLNIHYSGWITGNIYQTTTNDIGTHNVLITATDQSGLIATKNIQIIVKLNLDPFIEPISPKIINENELLTFNIVGHSPSNDEYFITINNIPKGAKYISPNFSWQPNFKQSGKYQLNILITDVKGRSSSTKVNIDVLDTVKSKTIKKTLKSGKKISLTIDENSATSNITLNIIESFKGTSNEKTQNEVYNIYIAETPRKQIELKQAIQLEAPYSSDKLNIRLKYLDETTSPAVWRTDGIETISIDKENKYITSKIMHFTKFSIFSYNDTNPPKIEWLKVNNNTVEADSPYNEINSVQVQLSEKKENDSGITSINFIIHKNNETLLEKKQTHITSANLIYEYIPTEAIKEEGNYEIKIQAEDASGIVSTKTWTLTIATTGTIRDFLLGPNPVNINKSNIHFSYYLSHESNIYIYIYDVSGKIIKKFKYQEGAVGAEKGSNIWTWDGRLKNGDKLSTGIYFVYIIGDSKNKEKFILMVTK